MFQLQLSVGSESLLLLLLLCCCCRVFGCTRVGISLNQPHVLLKPIFPVERGTHSHIPPPSSHCFLLIHSSPCFCSIPRQSETKG